MQRIVIATEADRWRAGRTQRAWPSVVTTRPIDALETAHEAVWMLRAGALPLHEVTPPPESSTGRPLIAVGATIDDGAPIEPWRTLLASTGGDCDDVPATSWDAAGIASIYADPRAAKLLARAWREHGSLGAALAHSGARIIRMQELDVTLHPALHVLTVITTIQHGGAERVAVDLHHAFQHAGLRSSLCTTSRPMREAFPARGPVFHLRDAREVATLAVQRGVDVIHAHLLNTDDVRRLAGLGFPTVATIHNAPQAWPEGTSTLKPTDADLLIACALSVEDALRDAGIGPVVRTAWNGISVDRTLPAGRRDTLGIPANALVVINVANARPQKRLEHFPAVIAALRRRGIDAHGILVGDLAGRSEASRVSALALENAIDAHHMHHHVHCVGPTLDVKPWLASADVFLSTSGWEGLSIAQLEALGAGLSVVTTDVGGAREMAAGNPRVVLVDKGATPDTFADAVVKASKLDGDGRAEVVRRFAIGPAARRHVTLLERVVRRRRDTGDGILLVTNNFSTGGAQTSARRLLNAWKARGIRVEAAVVGENPDAPTRGRRALVEAGIPVHATPPPGVMLASDSVPLLVEHIDRMHPRAVLLWNAMPQHKARLVDLLPWTRIVDVSPGEMYFDSLASFLAQWRGRPDVPLRDARDYGRNLHALVVKYAGETERARTVCDRVRVIPNGVPVAEKLARVERRERFIIGTVARISPQKKLEELFAALRIASPSLGPWVLRVVGGAETGCEAYAQSLVESARDLPIDWLGETTDASPALRDLDLFAMISEPAGCPNASLEAMAHGLAVVGTDHGGAREQILDGETGRITPRNDTRALADAIIELARDDGSRRRMAEAALARARTVFSMERMVDAYSAVCLDEK